MKNEKLFLLTPNNFAHKAGGGSVGRKYQVKYIHPAIQANPGSTQMTYLVEKIYRNEKQN